MKIMIFGVRPPLKALAYRQFSSVPYNQRKQFADSAMVLFGTTVVLFRMITRNWRNFGRRIVIVHIVGIALNQKF